MHTTPEFPENTRTKRGFAGMLRPGSPTAGASGVEEIAESARAHAKISRSGALRPSCPQRTVLPQVIMFRLVLLILSVALLARPEVRSWLAPHVGPVVQRTLDPVYRWSTRGRVAEIADALSATRAVGQPIPDSRGLPDFLRRYYHVHDAAYDPWGTPYFLERERDQLRVTSAGPDRRAHTPDDIRSGPVSHRGR